MAMALTTSGGPKTTLESLLPDVAQEVYGLGSAHCRSRSTCCNWSMLRFECGVRSWPTSRAGRGGRLRRASHRNETNNDEIPSPRSSHREQSLHWARDRSPKPTDAQPYLRGAHRAGTAGATAAESTPDRSCTRWSRPCRSSKRCKRKSEGSEPRMGHMKGEGESK
jgi:hypothetical protein